MVKNLSCVSYGSLKRFPQTFTTGMVSAVLHFLQYRWYPYLRSRVRSKKVAKKINGETSAGAAEKLPQ